MSDTELPQGRTDVLNCTPQFPPEIARPIHPRSVSHAADTELWWRFFRSASTSSATTTCGCNPSFWPGAGTYSPTQITLSDTTANATIYYTTDGSTPNTSSFAGYFVKYLQAYSAAGISVDYISLQNEPLFVPGN